MQMLGDMTIYLLYRVSHVQDQPDKVQISPCLPLLTALTKLNLHICGGIPNPTVVWIPY